MPNILFVDDEAFFSRDYVRELRRDHVVEFCDSAHEAIRFIEEDDSFNFLLLDIQMPTPTGVAEHQTNNGVDTGIYLLRMMRDDLIVRPMPVIVLTNRNPIEVVNKVEQLGYPPQFVEIYQKAHTSPQQIATKVGIMTRRWKGLV